MQRAAMPFHPFSVAFTMALLLEKEDAMRNLVSQASPFDNAVAKLREAVRGLSSSGQSTALACRLAGVTLVGAVRMKVGEAEGAHEPSIELAQGVINELLADLKKLGEKGKTVISALTANFSQLEALKDVKVLRNMPETWRLLRTR